MSAKSMDPPDYGNDYGDWIRIDKSLNARNVRRMHAKKGKRGFAELLKEKKDDA